MAYLTAADLREGTLHEAVSEFVLTDEEASTPALEAAIARASQRLDEWTMDHFEPMSATYIVDGDGTSRLALPQRCTAVDAVLTDGLTADVLAYRLTSSLNATGDVMLGTLDYLTIVATGVGINGYWGWPVTVSVTGDFGWTVTPPDVKRVVGFMVHDHFKSIRPSLRVAESVQTDTFVVRFPSADVGAGIFTGAPEIDDIIARYRRSPRVLIG